VLEEEREKARQKFAAHQNIVKQWFHKHNASDKDFDIDDLVLKWDKFNESKGKHTKLHNL
jgi:hypothetical protein